MSFNATVLYPATPDATFDLKYYISTHMPLAAEKWGSYGLKDWKVVEYQAGPDGSKPYSVAAIVTFESADGLKNALASEGTKAVFDDVPNFSKGPAPLFLMGDVVGTS